MPGCNRKMLDQYSCFVFLEEYQSQLLMVKDVFEGRLSTEHPPKKKIKLTYIYI